MARSANKPGPSNRISDNAKKTSKKSAKVETTPTSESRVSKDLQQLCLNIFRDALKPNIEDVPLVQEVKGHLFNRDFAAAFGREDYLRVYASRWSPSRALCYLQILDNVQEHILHDNSTTEAREDTTPFRVACLGGGAGGELIALAGWFHLVSTKAMQNGPQSIHVDLMDSAAWGNVAEELFRVITTPPELSAYASQAKKDSNRALLQPEKITISPHQLDLLDSERMARFEDVSKADLITCMFTLNELYGTSMPKTQQFLSDLTKSMRPGSSLLIVDSPGSYSTVSINGSEKKYPMQWLLDYTLRGPSSKADNAETPWERVQSNESQWFRRSSDLNYPIELEDMRYQLHLYRKADIGGNGNHHGG